MWNFTDVIGKISIRGHIGPSYVDEKGMFHKGVVLLDIIDQVMSQPTALSFDTEIETPGGYVDIGDDIYNYLTDVDKTRPVTTIQKGLIGSIGTKIFLAGSKRLVDERYEFWIHNPFKEKVTGDADQLRAEADATEKTEKDIRKFYGSFTPMGDVAIDALMKQETGLTADQCIKYGFATGKVTAPVFNIINQTKKMSTKKDPSLKDKFLALVGELFPDNNGKKGVPVKAAIPSGTENKSLVVNLADNAGTFYVEGEALVEGAACFLLDADGKPTAEVVQDGVYKSDKGEVVTVTGGKIAKLEMPTDPDEEEEEIDVDAKVKEAVDTALKAQKEEFEKKFNDLTLALKKDVKLGVQPKAAVLSANNGAPQVYKTIAMIQMEREAERRKKQLKGEK